MKDLCNRVHCFIIYTGNKIMLLDLVEEAGAEGTFTLNHTKLTTMTLTNK